MSSKRKASSHEVENPAKRRGPDMDALLDEVNRCKAVLAATEEELAQATKTVCRNARASNFDRAPPAFRRCPQIVLVVVTYCGKALKYADPGLQKDPKIVLAAVKDDGSALEYADPKLQKDPKIVLAAVKEYGRALEYADPELQEELRKELLAKEHSR